MRVVYGLWFGPDGGPYVAVVDADGYIPWERIKDAPDFLTEAQSGMGFGIGAVAGGILGTVGGFFGGLFGRTKIRGPSSSGGSRIQRIPETRVNEPMYSDNSEAQGRRIRRLQNAERVAIDLTDNPAYESLVDDRAD